MKSKVDNLYLTEKKKNGFYESKVCMVDITMHLSNKWTPTAKNEQKKQKHTIP